MLIGSKLKIFTSNNEAKVIETYKDCFSIILCDNPSLNCFLSKCNSCPGINALKIFLNNAFTENKVENITYSQWVNKPKADLSIFTQSTSVFTEELCKMISDLLMHDYICKPQHSFIKNLK